MQTFGEQLAAARRAKGMTQEALSQAADVARNTISSWERGRTVPDIDTVRKLSDILGCDLTQQIGAADAAPRVEAPMEPQKRRFRRPWLIAGAALIVCAAVCVLLFARRGAPPAGQDAFPLGEFLRAGIAAHGTDANGATLTFYGLVEF